MLKLILAGIAASTLICGSAAAIDPTQQTASRPPQEQSSQAQRQERRSEARTPEAERADQTLRNMEASCFGSIGQSANVAACDRLVARAYAAQPQNPVQLAFALAARCQAAVESGSGQAALPDCNQAVLLAPSQSYVYGARGRARDMLSDDAGAIADYSHAIGLDPSNAPALFNRGMIYSGQQNYSAAIADFSVVIALDPNDGSARFERGKVFMATGAYDRAVSDFDAAASNSPQLEHIHHYQAWGRFNLGQFAEARENSNAAILAAPADASGYYIRALANRAIGAETSVVLEDLNIAIGLAPQFTDAYSARGEIRAFAGMFSQALGDFNSALAINKDDTYALNGRCLVRAYMRASIESALQDCEQALLLSPNDPVILDSRGYAYLMAGRNREAWRSYDQSINAAPLSPGWRESDSASPYYGRGVAAWRLHRRADGRRDIEHAVGLDPSIEANYRIFGVENPLH